LLFKRYYDKILFNIGKGEAVLKKVIALFLSILTIFSAVAVFSAASSPLKIDAKASGNQYKVWWNYKANITCFYVYVDGKYDGYKNVNSSASYSYTTDPYGTGIKHKIYIKALKGKKTIAVSNTLSRVLAPSVPSLKFTGNENGYVISASCSGKYEGISLYKYDVVSEKYKFYKNFVKPFTVNSVSKSLYRAKAYVKYGEKTYYSQYCEPVWGAPQLGSVNLKSAVSKSSGKITVNWDKPSYSVSGYEIIYTSFDDFSFSHTVKASKSARSATLNLCSGVCYKIRVRAYKNKSGAKICGRWSNQKTLYTTAAVSSGADGKYLINNKLKFYNQGSTGCEKLNNALDKILAKVGCGKGNKKTNYEKLRAVYGYVASEQFKKDGLLGAKGSENYEEYSEWAVLKMLKNKGQTGSCYEYNYLFMYLCERLGVRSAYMASGTVSSSGNGRTGHFWAMIKIASNSYYFDPRMQRYVGGNKNFTFFCLPMNGKNTYSDYYRFYDAEEELM
jgi:hypothetical protein